MLLDVMPVLRDALAIGGEVLMRHFGKVEAERKGAIDLVTVADRESEEKIIARIRADFPDHAILAEEGGARESEGAAWRWIIDPLDGTTNYTHSLPMFCVTIGVEHRGEVVAGGTFNPLTDELFLAEKGAGATRNGEPMRVSACADIDDALVVTGFPYDRREKVAYYMAQFGVMLARTQGVLRLGSAGMDFAAVAAGRLEVFWERGLHPWDVAAGKLLVEEAGGRTSQFDGSAFDVYGGSFLATNGALHDEIVEILSGCPPWQA
jgi:myo-inositol-1(or 4)-monophosphatase